MVWVGVKGSRLMCVRSDVTNNACVRVWGCWWDQIGRRFCVSAHMHC